MWSLDIKCPVKITHTHACCLDTLLYSSKLLKDTGLPLESYSICVTSGYANRIRLGAKRVGVGGVEICHQGVQMIP